MSRTRVDIKLLLSSEKDFHTLLNIWEPLYLCTKEYEDFYFDTSAFLLMAKDAQLRLRVPRKPDVNEATGVAAVHDNDPDLLDCVTLTLKTNSSVDVGGQAAGISKVFPFSPDDVDDIVNEDALVSVLTRHAHDGSGKAVLTYLTKLAEEYKEQLELVRFASFKTVRRRYQLGPRSGSSDVSSFPACFAALSEGECPPRIYVDEVPLGDFKCYEIEVQGINEPSGDFCRELVIYLFEKGIRCTRSLSGKLNRFMTRTLELEDVKEESQFVRLRIVGKQGYQEVCRWQDEVSQPTQDTTRRWWEPPVDDDRVAFSAVQMASSPLGRGTASTQASRVTLSQNVGLKRGREDAGRVEEFFENYYFDDPSGKTLENGKYILRLRCSNPRNAFTLELRKELWNASGVTGYERKRSYISGDTARLMLQNPQTFLHSLPVQGNLGRLLRKDLGLEDLAVVGYCKVHRLSYKAVVSKRRMIGQSKGAGEGPLSAPQIELSFSQGLPSAGCKDEFAIQLNRIITNTRQDPVDIAKKVSEEHGCSLYDACGPSLPQSKGDMESYEVKLAMFPEELSTTAKDWLIYNLRQRQVQWEVAPSEAKAVE